MQRTADERNSHGPIEWASDSRIREVDIHERAEHSTMAAEPALTSRVRKPTRHILRVALFLLAGGLVTYVIAFFGPVIESIACQGWPSFQPTSAIPPRAGIQGWRATCEYVTIFRTAVASVPPNLSDDEARLIWEPTWSDNYKDPALASRPVFLRGTIPARATTVFRDGSALRILQAGDVVSSRTSTSVRSGLPFRCTHGHFSMLATGAAAPALDGGSQRGMLIMDEGKSVPGFMVYALDVPPFALNTIAFGAVIWVAVSLPLLLLQRLRVAGSRCGLCGYSLRSRASPCPECGNKGSPRQ